jgi:hypothetical protein
MEESITLVPALPIIMEAKYGPQAWSWFNKDGKTGTARWFYDLNTGIVCSEEDKQNTAIVRE